MGVRSPDTPKDTVKPRGKKAAPRELSCRVESGRGATRISRKGLAALGGEELRFHTGRTGRNGKDFFLHVRYDDISAIVVDAHSGTMTVTASEHPDAITYHLGKHAGDWKKLIEERPTTVDELGVKPGSRLALVGIDDDELLALLNERVRAIAGDTDEDLHMLFVGVEHRADLAQLGGLARRVRRPNGVVWAVYSTKARTLTEPEIAAAGRAAGLVDGGIVDLSRTRKALRLTRI